MNYLNKSTTFNTYYDSHSQANINVSQKYKIVLLGDQSVGKTSIINRFIFDTFDGKDHPTVGIDFISKTLYYDDKAVKLQIWDTAGQERFRSLIPGYIRDCTVAVIVYDVTNRQTYSNLKRWINDAKTARGNDVIIVIVGNKIDLEAKRTVTKEEGESIAKENETLFLEVSAKTGSSVANLFNVIAGFLPGNESHRVNMHEEQLNLTHDHNANINLINDPHIESQTAIKSRSCNC